MDSQEGTYTGTWSTDSTILSSTYPRFWDDTNKITQSSIYQSYQETIAFIIPDRAISMFISHYNSTIQCILMLKCVHQVVRVTELDLSSPN